MIETGEAQIDYESRESSFVAHSHRDGGKKKQRKESKQKTVIVSIYIEDIQSDKLSEIAGCLIRCNAVLAKPDK
ncbi:MAG: hypothetical protein BWY75_03076 [bacterium ADurb.Bin425]|nr:MAG: hypothetical protein BWY75_03076 [bacterium ADurb.Bin425]